MKSFLIAAAALCSVVSAVPTAPADPGSVAPWEVMAPPPAGTEFFQLQVRSTTTAVNGQWLSLKTGSSSYALAAAQTTAARFFSNLYNATGTYAVHNSDDTRQIVLQGASAPLLYLLDATNPRTDTIPKGQLMEWATFTTDGNVLGVKDGSTLTSRTFAAVKQTDGSYTLALYDGVSKVDATVTPVTINLVKAT